MTAPRLVSYADAVHHVRQAEHDGQITDDELERRLAELRRLYLLPTEVQPNRDQRL